MSVLCAANIVFFILAYDKVVEMVAVSQLALHESGAKYEAWTKTPMPVYYKVTIFNLTNHEEFMAGERPRLREIGPYVYRMMDEKVNVTFHDNGTVTYRTKPTYFFEPDLSGGTEDDKLYTVNIPLVNAADAVKDSPFLKTIIQYAGIIHNFETIRHLTVMELLWGHTSKVLDWGRQFQDVPYPHLKFGLLAGFNNSAQDSYTMYTGVNNPEKMNFIHSWNGRTKLNFWEGESCNRIFGTDAGGFSPGVKPSDELWIFNGQLCRSIPLVYQKTVNRGGINAFRFVPPRNVFSYGPKNPQNSCYCSQGRCPPTGVLDMKPCYYGAAIAFSFPHFYQADSTLRHMVRGLRQRTSQSNAGQGEGDALLTEGQLQNKPHPTRRNLPPVPHIPNKRSRCRRCCCSKTCSIIGFILSLTLGLTVYFTPYFEESVNVFVLGQLPLREGSVRASMWMSGNPPLLYRMYVFNLTNPREFLAGGLPRVRELGPFTYDVSETKENVVFNGSTVTFQSKPLFKFRSDLSVPGGEDIVVHTLNIPLVNAGEMTRNIPRSFGFFRDVLSFESIQKLTVKQLLWGYNSRLLNVAKKVQNIPYPYDHFALLAGRNYTLQPVTTIDTGVDNINSVNQVLSYDWPGPRQGCNAVFGSDGSAFGPKINESSILFIYNGQFCRSLPLVFSKFLVETQGLRAMRFTLPQDVFSYSDENGQQTGTDFGNSRYRKYLAHRTPSRTPSSDGSGTSSGDTGSEFKVNLSSGRIRSRNLNRTQPPDNPFFQRPDTKPYPVWLDDASLRSSSQRLKRSKRATGSPEPGYVSTKSSLESLEPNLRTLKRSLRNVEPGSMPSEPGSLPSESGSMPSAEPGSMPSGPGSRESSYKAVYGGDNRCFCDEGRCPQDGILDMKKCIFGAPVGFSFPHFLHGDPTLGHMTRGLRPDPAKHSTEFDIFPDLGIPLRVKLRMQMNVVLDQNQALSRARHYDLIYPIFWFEAGIDSLPPSLVGKLQMAQDLPPLMKQIFVVVCGVLTVVFLVLLMAQTFVGWCSSGLSSLRSRRSKDSSSNDTITTTPESDHSLPAPDHPEIGFPQTGCYTSFASPQLSSSDVPDQLIDSHTLLPPYKTSARLTAPDSADACTIVGKRKLVGTNSLLGEGSVTPEPSEAHNLYPPEYSSVVALSSVERSDSSRSSNSSLNSAEVHQTAPSFAVTNISAPNETGRVVSCQPDTRHSRAQANLTTATQVSRSQVPTMDPSSPSYTMEHKPILSVPRIVQESLKTSAPLASPEAPDDDHDGVSVAPSAPGCCSKISDPLATSSPHVTLEDIPKPCHDDGVAYHSPPPPGARHLGGVDSMAGQPLVSSPSGGAVSSRPQAPPHLAPPLESDL
ncbi:hypothetical protein HAZT_HAZT008805 [Hyalella azteca]|nr:hypothetical protein HAZT_HAZT008805 [Hyalella azteca]